jgi:hypothetical protein
MYLTSNGALQATRIMLENGADPNILDKEGKNSIYYVLGQEESAILSFIDLFWAYKIDLLQKPSIGKNFIECIIELNYFTATKEIIQLIDASKKEDRNIIGIIIKTEEEKSRALLKQKLGSKNFKYFDNKFRKKKRKSESSFFSDKDSSHSLLKFASNCKADTKKDSHQSLFVEKDEIVNKPLISPFFLSNEVIVPRAKSGENEIDCNGWLDDKCSGLLKFEFKTLECIKPNQQLANEEPKFEVPSDLADNDEEDRLMHQISDVKKVN